MATLAGAQTSSYAGANAWRVILEWLTTVDHKKIGIMYLWTAGAFGLVGMAFSLVMRTELAQTGTIISAETYNSIFTMHGSVMIFLFLLPIGAAFMNYSMPLQIGALDMAFPQDQRAVLLDLPVWRRADHAELRRRGRHGLGWMDRVPAGHAGHRQQCRASRGRDGYVVGWCHPVGPGVHLWFRELPGHDLQNARAGDDHVALAAVHLDDAGHGSADPALDPGAGRRAGAGLHRPQRRRRRILRSRPPADSRCSGRTCSGSIRIRPSTS